MRKNTEFQLGKVMRAMIAGLWMSLAAPQIMADVVCDESDFWYTLGFSQGERLIQEEWDDQNSECTDVSSFSVTVTDAATAARPDESDPVPIVCKYKGFKKGIESGLTRVHNQCQGSGTVFGEAAGKSAGRMLCKWAETGQDPGQDNIIDAAFGASYIVACKRVYGEYAQEHCPSAIFTPQHDRFRDNLCSLGQD